MRLQVTPAELQALARALAGLHGELQQAGEIRSISPAPAENVVLEAAIAGVIGGWAVAIGDLEARLDAVLRELDAAGIEYESTEQQVARIAEAGAAPAPEPAS